MLLHDERGERPPARVVVIGSGGFIGRMLVRSLQAGGIPALALGRADIDLTGVQAAGQLAALLKPDDAVVMLSALTPDRGRGIPPLQDNIRMMASLCAGCEKQPPSHVVYVSSDAVYPMTQGLVSETSAAEPTDLYAAMHVTRELMAKAAIRAPLAILRPTLVYGAEDTHNSYGPNRLRRMARTDARITLFGEGEEMRDHISVDDVSALIMLVLRHRSRGLLNLATGRSISYRDLAVKIADLFDTPVEITGTPRQSPITHRHFDVTALQKCFPAFVFQSLEDGLAKAHRDMLADDLAAARKP